MSFGLLAAAFLGLRPKGVTKRNTLFILGQPLSLPLQRVAVRIGLIDTFTITGLRVVPPDRRQRETIESTPFGLWLACEYAPAGRVAPGLWRLQRRQASGA